MEWREIQESYMIAVPVAGGGYLVRQASEGPGAAMRRVNYIDDGPKVLIAGERHVPAFAQDANFWSRILNKESISGVRFAEFLARPRVIRDWTGRHAREAKAESAVSRALILVMSDFPAQMLDVICMLKPSMETSEEESLQEPMIEMAVVSAGDSLEEAKAALTALLPVGCSILSEQVISDGATRTVRTKGATTAAAAAPNARCQTEPRSLKGKRCPGQSGADLCRWRLLTRRAPGGWPESKKADTALIADIRLVGQARKGFLGIGNRLNQYQVEIVVAPAIVEVTYRTKARISVTVAGTRAALSSLKAVGG